MLAIYIIIVVTIHILKDIQVFGQPNPDSARKISAKLLSALEAGNTPDALITFLGGNREPLQRSSQLNIDDRGQRNAVKRDSLVEHSDQSQEEVLQTLSSLRSTNEGIEFRKFWVTNQMWLQGGDLQTIQTIAEDPQVSFIDIEPEIELFDLEEWRLGEVIDRPEDGVIQWNIERIRVPEAWQELGGSKGDGVVVGILDSGALHTHETLRDNFLGDYGWFDASKEHKQEPYDDTWHGTSVASSAVGSRGIGTAPGAKWSSCKSCAFNGGCQVEWVLECVEFFACPTLADGSNPDCSKAPHIIVNSWGSKENTWDPEESLLDAWTALGIIPVFSAGNYDKCMSIGYPGSYRNAIAVGNIDINNSTAGTDTSKGPTSDGRIKPDIVAFGKDVMCAYAGGDDKYVLRTGTSFSGPQLAGVVALLLSRDLEMTFSQVKEFLYNNTNQEILQGSDTCASGVNDVLTFPNNHYGYGLVDAFQTVKAQSNEMSSRWIQTF